MEDFDTASMTDDRLMKLAEKRVKLKTGFIWDVTAYILVNIFLTIIWLITGGGYFWPMWPILGWGLGLAFHGASVLIELSRRNHSDAIYEEYKRLKGAGKDEVNYEYYVKDPNSN